MLVLIYFLSAFVCFSFHKCAVTAYLSISTFLIYKVLFCPSSQLQEVNL